MKIVRKVKGDYYEIETNNLYKTRQDNNLSTDLLVSKYTGRIVDGTLNGTRKLEGWEANFGETLSILDEISEQIKDINDKLRG